MAIPVPSVDADFDRVTARLSAIGFLAAGVAVLLPLIALPGAGLFYGGLFALLTLWSLATHVVVGSRWPHLAPPLMFLSATVLVVAITFVSGGVESPAYTSYMLVLLGAACLIFPPRLAALWLILLGGLGAVLAWAGASGRLPEPWVAHTAWSRWLATAGAGLVLFVTQFLEMRRMVRQLLATQQEVAQRERAEQNALVHRERFHEIVSMLPGVVYELEIDPAGSRHFTFVSQGVTDFLGVEPGDVLRDPEAIFELVAQEDRAGLEASLADSSRHLAPWRHEARMRTVHGEQWVEGRAMPTRLSDGTVRWYGVLADQTERRSLEQQLLQAQKMEALGTLAGGIAHDFNNLLTVIIGQADLAGDMAEGQPRLAETITEIRGAGVRAGDLVRQILDFSQPRAAEWRPVDLAAVVEDAIKLLRPGLPASVVIETRLARDAHVLADPSQIHQVITNLAVNAQHAMREGAGRLEVTLDVVVPGEAGQPEIAGLARRPHARLRVQDTGHGMSPETARRIFEPFFTTKRRGEGSGLGLAVVHGIVHRHGGAITVDSRPGSGTAFDVFLPLPGPEPARPVASAARDDVPVRSGQGQHVLVIDDEEAIVRLVTTALGRQGYRVTGATDPREALARFAAAPDAVDVVVTDLTMPQLSGLEVAQQIVVRRPDMPIVLCSGFSAEWTRERMAQFGIREFLPKPLTPARLGDAVARALAASPTRHPEAPGGGPPTSRGAAGL